MSLHIIAIYFGKSDRNKHWLRLQKQFIEENTSNYRFSVFLNNCDQSVFRDVDIIGVKDEIDTPPEQDHLKCLNEVLQEFDGSCGTYLILDSDCFPIMPGWHSILLDRMSGYDIAAPYRTENLEIYPHPSAVFMNVAGLKKIRFVPARNSDNLLGIYNGNPTFKGKCFPLIRTNRVNHHQIGAAVYYDMFYHHGAGSRPPRFKIHSIKYLQDDGDLEKAYQQLMCDPKRFISSIRRSQRN